MKRILRLLIATFLILILLSSCGKGNGGSSGGNENDTAKIDGVSIVCNIDGVDSELINSILKEVAAVTGKTPAVKSPDSPDEGCEIVVGDTSREITKKAYILMDRIDRPAADYVRYLVYSDGESVAIIFDGETLGSNFAEQDAVDSFLAVFKNNSADAFKKGVISKGMHSVIERQRQVDKINKEEDWDKAQDALSDLYGESAATGMINALRELYQLYVGDAVAWLADLYDPKTGGFYYSNSARDTEGYLPDLESTYQALSLIEGTGMLRAYGGSVKKAIPEWMQEQIVAFAKSCQDPDNGYFYHPQWSKMLVDSLPQRRGRDLSNGVNILSKFGKLPTYDTPSGVKGDGILADGTPVFSSSLLNKLGESSVSAVSKVLFVNSDANVTPHLRDKASFEAYLKNLEKDMESARPYYVGNLLESQANQILARDEVLKARDEDYSLCDILADWFGKYQNQKTGTWLESDEINYEGVNGILKISSCYNRIKRPVPNPELCIRAAMTILLDETPANHVCDILNPWYAITVIRNNLTEHEGDDSKYTAMLDEMADQFIRSVGITKDKLATLLRTDGSFGYLPESSASSAQGVPAAVPNTWEGDVNATYLATSGIMGHLFTALGVSDYRVPIFTKADFMRFLYIVENLGEVIKDEPYDDRESAKGTYAHKYGGIYYIENTSTYDLNTVYRYTTEVRHDMELTKETHEYMRIVSDEKRDSGVLEYGKASQESYYGLCFGRARDKVVGNCFVFETELKINYLTPDAKRTIGAQGLPVLLDLQLAKTTELTAAHVSTNVFYDKIGGIYLTDTKGDGATALSSPMVNWQYRAAGCLGESISANKWYTITVEVYDNGIAKYFVDNEYVGEAKVLSDPSIFSEVDTVRLALNSSATSCTVWLDNTFVGNVDKEFVSGGRTADYGDYEFKAGEHYENFGGLDYNTSLVKTLENSGFIVRSTYFTKDNMEGKSWNEMTYEYVRIAERSVENKVGRVLEFTTLQKNAKGIYLRETVSGTEGDCFVFETDLSLEMDLLTSHTTANSGQNRVASIYASKVAAASSVTGTDMGTSYAEIGRIYVAKDAYGRIRYYINYPDSDISGAAIVPADITSGTHTFTAEIYKDTGCIKYFVDGMFVGEFKGASDALTESFDEICAVKITFNDKIDNSSIILDNTFVGRVDKDYVFEEVGEYEEPAPPEDDKPVTPGTGLGSETDDGTTDGGGWN